MALLTVLVFMALHEYFADDNSDVNAENMLVVAWWVLYR